MNFKRPIVGCLLLAVLFQLAFFCRQMFLLETPEEMQQINLIDIETVWSIEDTHKAKDEFDQFILYADGFPLPYDKESRTFFYPLPLDSTDWPTIVLSLSMNQGLEAYLVDDITSDDKQQAVASSTRYEIIAYDDTTYAYYGLIFTGLPVLTIHTETQQDITLEKTSAQISLYDPQRENYLDIRSEIRLRGAGTLVKDMPKRCYRFWMKQQGKSGKMVEQSAQLLGMASSSSWNLLAMYADPSLMRDKAGMDIWAGFASGATNTYFGVNGEYIELFIDDTYCGVYLLSETVDKQALATRGHTSRFQQDYLYRGVAAWYDWAFRYEVYFDPHGKTPDCGFHLRYPDYGRSTVPKKDWEQLETYLALRDTMSWDQFCDTAGELLDVPSIVDYWLLLQTLVLTDNNVNIWAHDTGSGYVLSLFPWDLSDSWSGIGGSVTIEQLLDEWLWDQNEDLLLQVFGGIIPFRLSERVLAANINDSQRYLTTRWAQLREGVLSEEAIDVQFKLYEHFLNDSGASLRDGEKWFGESSYITLAKDMALWLQMRCAILDTYFTQMDWSTLWSQIDESNGV